MSKAPNIEIGSERDSSQRDTNRVESNAAVKCGFAEVGRSGLANMLLPWARCEVFCHAHQIPMLAPQWIQLKIGPLLRRETDSRYYIGLFSNASYVRGLRKWWLMVRCKKVAESELPAQLASSPHLGPVFRGNEGDARVLVIFRGLGKYFADISGHEEFLARRLRQIVSDRCNRALNASRLGKFVAVHIRRGDKPVLAFGAEPPAHTMHWTVPTDWYVRCIEQVKQVVSADVPVVVFTDGEAEQIQSVLRLPGVRLAPKNPAVVDMLLMSEAQVLITSASSTFSMWPAFLGQMPSIWFPAQWREQTNWKHPEFECYTDLEGNLPEGFVQVLTTHQKQKAEK